MTEDQIKHMVNRFLSWKLPESFNPDGGISFKKTFNEHTDHPMKHEPSGTNLFDFTQANAMVRHMVEGARQLPRLEEHQTGSALVFEHGSLSVNRDGTARFVYIEDDAEFEVEEGRTFLIHRINNEELIWLRDRLNQLFPVAAP